MKLITLLIVFVLGCNGLLLGSQNYEGSEEQAEAIRNALREYDKSRRKGIKATVRFNEAIQNAIATWDVERTISDDEEKRNNKMEDIITYLNGGSRPIILPDLFKNNDVSYDCDSIMRSIAHYHAIYNLPLGNGYKLRRYEGQVPVSIKKQH